jgi:hypothetical protein
LALAKPHQKEKKEKRKKINRLSCLLFFSFQNSLFGEV